MVQPSLRTFDDTSTKWATPTSVSGPSDLPCDQCDVTATKDTYKSSEVYHRKTTLDPSYQRFLLLP